MGHRGSIDIEVTASEGTWLRASVAIYLRRCAVHSAGKGDNEQLSVTQRADAPGLVTESEEMVLDQTSWTAGTTAHSFREPESRGW